MQKQQKNHNPNNTRVQHRNFGEGADEPTNARYKINQIRPSVITFLEWYVFPYVERTSSI